MLDIFVGNKTGVNLSARLRDDDKWDISGIKYKL